jgi:hypothetical protein
LRYKVVAYYNHHIAFSQSVRNFHRRGGAVDLFIHAALSALAIRHSRRPRAAIGARPIQEDANDHAWK